MASNSDKEKKDDKKGAGVPWAARGGPRVVSATAHRTAGQSFLAWVAGFFASGTGMLALTAAIAGASLLSYWGMNHPREGDAMEEGTQALGEGRRARGYEGTPAPRQAPANGDSLGYLARGNPGAAVGDEGQPVADAAQSAAGPAAAYPPPGGKDAPDNANTPANAPTAFPKTMGQLSTSTGGGSGGASYGGMPASHHPGAHEPKGLLAQAPAGAAASTTLRPPTKASSSAVRRATILSGGKSGAMGQLRASAGMSRAALGAGGAESQAYGARQAFEGTSSAIGGPGGAIGGSGAASGQGNGLDAGNPVNSVNKSQANPPTSDSGQNETPWQSMVYTAMGLLAVGALLLMVGSQMNKAYPLLGKGLAIAAAAAGAAAALIGLRLMAQYHQTLQGAIFMGGGAVLGALGAIVAMGGTEADPKTALLNKSTSLYTSDAGYRSAFDAARVGTPFVQDELTAIPPNELARFHQQALSATAGR